MSTSEFDLARRIGKHLDRGAAAIEPDTLARLRAARLAAVERMRTEPVSLLVRAGTADRMALQRYLSPRYLLPIVAMVLTVSALAYWQQQRRTEDPVEIDAKLLSSELPIDALLDKGLDQWLQQ